MQIVRREGMHRLIPSKWSSGGTVLAEIATDEAMLADLVLLDGATNGRIQGESHGLAGISPYELVYGIPHAQIIRAAFLHTGPAGSRFSDATRGAWYAAVALETSVAEVSFHKARRLGEMVVPGMPFERPDRETTQYDDWEADFHAAFHALEPVEDYAEYLQAEPVPECYRVSQRLARDLLEKRSNGVIYPSVRHKGGVCVACFRPALVYRPRLARQYELRLTMALGGDYEAEMVEVG